MNIFVLHEDPKIAAQQQCDKHVVKMVLESAQLLCTAVNLTGGEAKYKVTHKNHPCSVWARSTKGNFNWLKVHALALCEEYTRRYNKRHKSQDVIEAVSDATIPDGELESFVLTMPEQYKTDNPIESYREFYRREKKGFAKWKHSSAPEWWVI